MSLEKKRAAFMRAPCAIESAAQRETMAQRDVAARCAAACEARCRAGEEALMLRASAGRYAEGGSAVKRRRQRCAMQSACAARAYKDAEAPRKDAPIRGQDSRQQVAEEMR